MGFTKLDEGIVRSSVWSEAYPTRILWVTMLAMCNSKGFVASSRSGLVREANITELEFEIAIAILEAPDKDSRSPEFEGRRVEKRDGGWQVLNYPKYRNYSYSASPEAVRQRKHRSKAKERDGSLHVTKRRDISASASVSASVSKGKMQEGEIEAKFTEFWSAYPQDGRLAKKESRIKFGALCKRGELEQFIKGFHGYLDFLKHQRLKKNFDQTPLYAKTFLNGRWQEYVDFKYEAEL